VSVPHSDGVEIGDGRRSAAASDSRSERSDSGARSWGSAAASAHALPSLCSRSSQLVGESLVGGQMG